MIAGRGILCRNFQRVLRVNAIGNIFFEISSCLGSLIIIIIMQYAVSEDVAP